MEPNPCGTSHTCSSEVSQGNQPGGARAGIPGGEHGLKRQSQDWTGRTARRHDAAHGARCHGTAARRQHEPQARLRPEISRPQDRDREDCRPEGRDEEGRDEEGRPEGHDEEGRPETHDEEGRPEGHDEEGHDEEGRDQEGRDQEEGREDYGA